LSGFRQIYRKEWDFPMKYETVQGNGRTIHYAICERCEERLEHVGSIAQRYCPECQIIVKREKTAERVRRYREKQMLKEDIQ
jgi:exosome complex RNA-binding protein Csl4